MIPGTNIRFRVLYFNILIEENLRGGGGGGGLFFHLRDKYNARSIEVCEMLRVSARYFWQGNFLSYKITSNNYRVKSFYCHAWSHISPILFLARVDREDKVLWGAWDCEVVG